MAISPLVTRSVHLKEDIGQRVLYWTGRRDLERAQGGGDYCHFSFVTAQLIQGMYDSDPARARLKEECLQTYFTLLDRFPQYRAGEMAARKLTGVRGFFADIPSRGEGTASSYVTASAGRLSGGLAAVRQARG